MAERLLGVETEYGFSAVTPGTGRQPERDLRRLMLAARRRLLHLPDGRGTRLYLANGGCLYVDHGLHPELCTPECSDPWELVRYVKAGDRILLDLARELESRTRGLKVRLFRGNVGYGRTLATWGFHESYLHRAPPREMAGQLLPHLASRLVYSGSGGLNPFAPGIEFTLSPRAWHLTAAVSEGSTRDRGIFHTRSESLCEPGWQRLHVLCGDSPCSETTLWLTVATTALVVSLVEGGQRPGDLVALARPVAALRKFAGDPSCTARAELEHGAPRTAIEIQRHYLSLAEARLGAGWMPSWAAEACVCWRRVLDELERDPDGLSRSLDWVMKLALHRAHLRRRLPEPNLLQFWNGVLVSLTQAAREAEVALPLKVDMVLDPASPIAQRVRALGPLVRGRDLDWPDLAHVLACRLELCALETRFSQLGDGIFAELDRAGVIDHRIPGVGDVERAMEHPPQRSRARIRGEVVRRLARKAGVSCGWSRVVDLEAGRGLDLSDPFARREEWVELRGRDRAEQESPDLRQRVLRFLDL